MKYITVTFVLAFALYSPRSSADNAYDSIKDQLAAAQSQAQDDLSNGNGHKSSFLEGTWTFMKRLCISDLTPEAIDNPDEVFDIDGYYNVITYTGNSEQGTNINADKENHRCISQASGAYSSVPVSIELGFLNITEVLAVEMTERKKVNCDVSYQGPVLAKAVDVVKVDDNTVYFFLLPNQLTSPVNCTNPNDFNMDLAVRVQDVP